MVPLQRVIACIALGWIAANSPMLLSQEPEEGDFSITSSISLGLSGFSTSTQFKLVDELGFEYDAMSLLRDPMVRARTGVDDHQFDEIQNQWKTATEPMVGMVLDTVLMEQKKDEIKALFEQAQADILDLLEPEQVEQLESARHQIGIERFGCTEYLSSKRVSEQLGLTPDQAQSLADGKAEFRINCENLIRRELIDANTALLATLNDDQRLALRELLSQDAYQAFLSSRMLTEAKSLRQRPEQRQTAIAAMTRNKKTRRNCDVDASQYEAMKILKRKMRNLSQEEVANELQSILRPEQITKLELAAIKDQVKRLGTVEALCHGILAEHLELNEDEADALFQRGNEIAQEFIAKLASLTSQAIQESLATLSPEQQQQVLKMIGNADPLKSTR